jgi:hypothetical protein
MLIEYKYGARLLAMNVTYANSVSFESISER